MSICFKKFAITALICSTSCLCYGSYTHKTSGPPPLLDESEQNYQAHITAYKQWIEAGSSEAGQETFNHLSAFKKVEDDVENAAPLSVVEATCYFMDKEQKVNVDTYIISLPHLTQSSSAQQDQYGYHYLEGVLYQPLHQQIIYKLPAIAEVEGLEQELNYTKYNYTSAGQELPTIGFDFTLEPEQKTLPNGYYQSRLRREQPHGYIYSSKIKEDHPQTELFMARAQEELLDFVNQSDLKATFKFLFKTPHKILLKPGYTITNTSGVLPEGIFTHAKSQQPDSWQWQQVEKNLSLKDPSQSYTLSHPEGLYFQTIDLDPNTPTDQVLKDLRLSSVSQLIESLDFKGRVFNTEKPALMVVLQAMTQLTSLNLTKADTTVDYNDLVPTLKTLTNLKSLNLTNGQVTEEHRQQLATLAGLEIIPAPQPAQPTPETAPVTQPLADQTTVTQPVQPAQESTPDAQLPAVTTDQTNVAQLPQPTPETQPTITNPDAPATAPVVAPTENGEPVVDPTPTVTPVASVTEPVTSTGEVTAAILAAPATPSTDQ